jgi:hypothetical protein
MWKKAIVALIVAGVGYSVYDYYTGPFYDAPALNEGDFLLAFKGDVGLKGVMHGFGYKDQTRKYVSYGATDVPRWYHDTWSICRKPQEGEVTAFEGQVNMGPGGRFEAVCEIDADGDVFVRGWIVSVPDL